MDMLMNKILLPVDFPNVPLGVVHQAAFLARHFHSEIILLHVVAPLSFPAGVLESGDELTARDLHAHIVLRAQKDLDQALRPELEGIVVKRLLLKGDPPREIVQTARDEKVSLIVMSRHSHGSFYRFLLGSVAAKVLHDSVCPIWTDTYREEALEREFAIRNILCAVDMSSHSRNTVIAGGADGRGVWREAYARSYHRWDGELWPRRILCRPHVEGKNRRLRRRRDLEASAGRGYKGRSHHR